MANLAKTRGLARQRAMQAIYQWQMAQPSLKDIETQFLAEQNMEKVDMEYFRDLLYKVPAMLDEIDAHLTPHMQQREIDEVDPVERAILRIATYELSSRLDIPYKVIINEAVEMCKNYGAAKSHGFINGVLDKTAQVLRTAETKK